MKFREIGEFFLRLLAPKPTLAEFNSAMNELALEAQRMRDVLVALKEVAEVGIKVYTCSICAQDFARLPHQSPKRCPACVQKIHEQTGFGAQSNSGHRGLGHDTRGVHKKVGP